MGYRRLERRKKEREGRREGGVMEKGRRKEEPRLTGRDKNFTESLSVSP